MEKGRVNRIGIVGSRRRNTDDDFLDVELCFLTIYRKGDIIISGGCPRGGDRFAELLADMYDVPIVIFKPDWSKGRHAGFLRNTLIAENSDELIACVASDRTGGTEDTIRKFKKVKPDGIIHLC